jgi:hypothetical protein
MIIIKIIGKTATLNDWGIITNEIRNPKDIKRISLNQIVFFSFRNSVKNAANNSGLSQMILKFIFMA